MTGRRGRRRRQLLDDLRKKILETERRSTRSQTTGNLFWKGLWITRWWWWWFASVMNWSKWTKQNYQCGISRRSRTQRIFLRVCNEEHGLWSYALFNTTRHITSYHTCHNTTHGLGLQIFIVFFFLNKNNLACDVTTLSVCPCQSVIWTPICSSVKISVKVHNGLTDKLTN